MSLFRVVFLIICLRSLAPAAEPNTPVPSFRQLAQKARYIFAGTVLQVHKIEPAGPYGVATIRVSLRVDRPILGVHAHQVIAIREWAGLWEDGDRYREGERLLLFLYGKSKLGLTSVVAGDSGRFNVDRGEKIVLQAARAVAVSDQILKISLRSTSPRNRPTVRGHDFRRAVVRAQENEP